MSLLHFYQHWPSLTSVAHTALAQCKHRAQSQTTINITETPAAVFTRYSSVSPPLFWFYEWRPLPANMCLARNMHAHMHARSNEALIVLPFRKFIHKRQALSTKQLGAQREKDNSMLHSQMHFFSPPEAFSKEHNASL